MPLKNNRRRSLRSGETSYRKKTPPPKQTHLTPLNRVIKRTYSKSSSTESFSRLQDTTLTQCGYVIPQDSTEINTTPFEKKARRSTGKRVTPKSLETQTLTQAGFVFYQSPVDENMAYDEVSTARNPSPLSRKRRRNELEEPITSRTRSAKKRAAEHIVKRENDVDKKDELKLAPESVVRQSVATVPMPPPKTPQSTRRREVPSSQSPADTPLSTRSRRSRDVLRSPLKAKSVNVRRRIISPGETKSWARMGVAADSLEFEDDNDEDPQTLAASATSVKVESLNASQPLAAPRKSQVDDRFGARPEDATPSGGGPYPMRKAGKLKSEISDSDNDIDETDEENFGPGSDSQDDMSGPNPEKHSSSQAAADLATGLNIIPESEDTPKRGARIARQTNTPMITENEVGQLFATPRPARNAQTRAVSRPWLPLTIVDHQSAGRHNRHRLPTNSPSNSHVPSTSSPVDISRPLINNFSPQKSPHAVPETGTGSQLRKALRDFTPPPTVDTGSTPELPIYPVDVQPQQPQAPPHQPQQQQLPPVPPSQATTVDEITQHSSPPHAPISSSSPHPASLPFINADDNDINDDNNPPGEEPDTLARDIGGWEAVRLSDSQLQIDSLIDDDDAMLIGRGTGHPHVSLLSSSPMRYDGGGVGGISGLGLGRAVG